MNEEPSSLEERLGGAASLDCAEVLTVAVEHLKHLGPVTLVLEVPGVRREVWWTSSRERYQAAALEGTRAAFSPLELEAFAGAYERDRLTAEALTEWSVRKLRNASSRVTPVGACGGVVPSAPRRARTWVGEGHGVPGHWTDGATSVGQLVRWLGARLVRVEFEGDESAAGEVRAA